MIDFSKQNFIFSFKIIFKIITKRQRGAMVARQTLDQMVACSNHVVVNPINNSYIIIIPGHFKK